MDINMTKVIHSGWTQGNGKMSNGSLEICNLCSKEFIPYNPNQRKCYSKSCIRESFNKYWGCSNIEHRFNKRYLEIKRYRTKGEF